VEEKNKNANTVMICATNSMMKTLGFFLDRFLSSRKISLTFFTVYPPLLRDDDKKTIAQHSDYQACT
jgi:hypothetical protein